VDFLSVAGLILAVVAILAGATLKGAGIQVLVSLLRLWSSCLVRSRAICVQTSLTAMKRALNLLPWIVRPPAHDGGALIDTIVQWSSEQRRLGIIGAGANARDPALDEFLRKGLQMVWTAANPKRCGP